MTCRRRVGLSIILTVIGLIWLNNTTLSASPPRGHSIVIAHRGVAQQFDRTGLGQNDCTADRIRPPRHSFIENTIPSMREAFRMGADIVEVDVSSTVDNRIVLFHDWTLDCRTNGHGDVRLRTLAELKRLDVGHGYTADQGATHPFRSRGIGLMPSLEEALRALPGRPLLINFKGNDPAEADLVAAEFRRAGRRIDARYSFYGSGPRVLGRMRTHAPQSWIFDMTDEVQPCLLRYLAIGWLGIVPRACAGGTIALPVREGWLAWGWPNRFLARMQQRKVRTILFGSAANIRATSGIETSDQLAEVPAGYAGYLWVEDIAGLPELRRR